MNLYIPFLFASAILLVIPGPTVILVISQVLNHGRKSVLPLTFGVFLGDFTAMTLSLLGLGAVLSASAAVFSLFKWAGAAYLIYLGIKNLRAKPENREVAAEERGASNLTLLKSSYLVTALNPKSIAFFVAFLPQFIEPEQAAFPQLVLLGGTFLILAAVNAALYGLFAGRIRGCLKDPRGKKWFGRCSGTALIGAGILTAGVKHSS